MKRKFVLVEVTYTLEGDQQKHSKNHLVSLYVKNNLPSQQSQEMEMAVEKSRLWYNEVFPQKKIISIVPSETISSDFSLRTLSNEGEENPVKSETNILEKAQEYVLKQNYQLDNMTLQAQLDAAILTTYVEARTARD
jgi:hypothetical protein